MTSTAHVKIKNPTVTSAENYIWMVGEGDLLGCILVGPAGMGKTHLVQHTLEQMNVEYKQYGGHITLAAIFEYLYENQDKLIFFDDCSQLINNTEIMELLKQAINISSKDRTLHYRSKGISLPVKEFNFTGRLIMAFNTLDSKNPNVKAITSRAPMIELKYSYSEIIKAMYEIAKSDVGFGLLTHEKMIVTREIETYADSSMDISLRTQIQAFKIYGSFKKRFGEGNIEWKTEVHKLCGHKTRSWIYEMVKNEVDDKSIKRTELAKMIALRMNMSVRNAQRRINEFLEIEEIYQDKLKGGNISIKPFI